MKRSVRGKSHLPVPDDYFPFAAQLEGDDLASPFILQESPAQQAVCALQQLPSFAHWSAEAQHPASALHASLSLQQAAPGSQQAAPATQQSALALQHDRVAAVVLSDEAFVPSIA